MHWKRQSEYPADNGAQAYSHGKRSKNTHGSPFKAAGFFFYSHAGSGAWKMEQREDYHADRRCEIPAVCSENTVQFRSICDLYKTSLCKISHKNYGNNDLIGRESQYKAKKNNAVKSDESAEWIKEVRRIR